MVMSIRLALVCVTAASFAGMATQANAEDIGKKACYQDAKQLCPDDVKALSRSRVRACLIKNIDKTSAFCHATMLKLKAENQASPAQTKN